jgi:hypothetical protein
VSIHVKSKRAGWSLRDRELKRLPPGVTRLNALRRRIVRDSNDPWIKGGNYGAVAASHDKMSDN